MPFAALDGTANGYRQARELVQAGRALAAAEPSLPVLSYYEDYLPLCTCLSAYGSEAPALHIHPHIVRLAAHDKEHGSQYLHTLEVWFAAGRNMTKASKALFIHKTTLFYRFERMEKLVGPFMEDQKLLFLYEYSLHLLHAFSPEK